MKCPYCGCENPNSYKYCHECGCPLNYSNFNNSNNNSNNFNNNNNSFNNSNNNFNVYSDSKDFSNDFPNRNTNFELSKTDKKKIIIIGYIIAILFGWGTLLFSLLFGGFGFFGFFGLFFPGFMLNSKDSSIKKHGVIQLLITLIGIIFTLWVLFH